MRRTVPRLLAVVVLLSVASLGIGGTSAGASPVRDGAPASILPRMVIVAFSYVPDPVVVRPRQRVTVLNVDDIVLKAIPGHSVTANNGSFNTGVFRGTATFRAPGKRGVYLFHCLVHSFMHGVLVVR
jgi:plastocyanin